MSAVFATVLAIAFGAAAPPIQAVYDAESRSVVVPRVEFLNLHASMALGETRLAFPRTPEIGLGRLEMGRHVDWDANHVEKEAPPVDGSRILRKRVGADAVRLALQTWSEEKVGYPAAADLRSADGWVELVLPPLKMPAEGR